MKNVSNIFRKKALSDTIARTLIEIIEQPKVSLPRKLLKEHYQLVRRT